MRSNHFVECEDDQFRCYESDFECIDEDYVCDKIPDCANSEDEQNCTFF